MIEVRSKSGLRRLIKCSAIIAINELFGEGDSKSVITLSNGEVIFTSDTYEMIKESYYMAKEEAS